LQAGYAGEVFGLHRRLAQSLHNIAQSAHASGLQNRCKKN